MAKRMRRNPPHQRIYPTILLIILLLTSAVWLQGRIRPAVEAVTRYRAYTIGMLAVNQALEEELEEHSLSYGDLIELSYDDEGNITALKSNMQQINRFKTQVALCIQQKLASLEEQTILIPAGTLTGSTLLAGRGPSVRFVMRPTGYIKTDIHHVFTDAGINQTRHRIMLTVSAHISAFVPGYMAESELSTEIGVAETILVGHVPNTFVQLKSSDLLSPE